MGYQVFNVNLKTSVDLTDVSTILENLAWDITDSIMEMEDGELHCVYEHVQECPAIQRSWAIVFDKIKDMISFASIVAGILAIPAAVFRIMRNKTYLVAILVLLMVWVAVYNARFTYQLSFSIFHMKDRIKQGEWSAIFCCLNSMKECSTLGPVLIVRDIKNFQTDQLHKFFAILAQKKELEGQEEIKFPIIMETPDNLWMEKVYSDTSNSAFKFYYVKPMTYREGMQDLVERYRVFNEETYEYLYNELRGHTRFYEYVWMNGGENGKNYTDVINDLMIEAYIILNMCLLHVKEKDRVDVKMLLQHLQNSSFTLHVDWLTITMQQLIACNLLFYDAINGSLMVQNHLLERAIAQKLQYL